MVNNQIVAVLGASPKPERYANKAIKELLSHGHQVIPVSPGHDQIEEIPCMPSLASIQGDIDTLTVYVGPNHINSLIDEIIKSKPKRVILNPGTESETLQDRLDSQNIPWIHACTLVLLRTNQF